MTDPSELYAAIRAETDRVLVGNERIIEGLTVALLSGGNVLLEGVPGIAKTTAVKVFARATGLEYSRIQMTPDVLPADITGTEVYREPTGQFETKKGPLFSNIVLADEINRATPKTQSALLEAMAEQTVTIGGEDHSLPDPFLLVATQNPIEMEGTFALPEAQRDRFQQKLTMGIPSRDNERAILDRFDDEPTLGPEAVERAVTVQEIADARATAEEGYVASSIKQYILSIVEATRDHEHTAYGASPRASLAFLQAGKNRAAIHGREYVVPDDVKALAEAVLSHRLVLDTDAEISGITAPDVVDTVLESVSSPSGESFEPEAEMAASDGSHRQN
jgi:MoxR-like ATPase